jgi:hypothetical protein
MTRKIASQVLFAGLGYSDQEDAKAADIRSASNARSHHSTRRLFAGFANAAFID